MNSRITCTIHHSISSRLVDALGSSPTKQVLLESCRNVRQVRRPRPLGLPGHRYSLDDAPGDRLHILCSSEHAQDITNMLAQEAQISLPGRGSIIHQKVHLLESGSSYEMKKTTSRLSQITCILSQSGAGEDAAEVILALGIGVPVVTRGFGTGIRDRLGLLRITIPPEKELVHCVVPSHDAEGIMQLIIEQAALDRPGGGFMYQTPVDDGMVDTRMIIGPQEHMASIEQIIAAVDDLKGDTSWRKRYIEPDFRKFPLLRRQKEIALSCVEGLANPLITAAMTAGAGGATIARMQRTDTGAYAAWERISCIVPEKNSSKIMHALEREAEHYDGSSVGPIEVIDVPRAYSYGS